MFDVAILGAGELGGELTHQLAKYDLARAVRLIDEKGSVAAGKALDITQAGPIERFATRVTGSAEVADAAGAQVVVIADRADGGEWSGDEGLALLKRITSVSCPIIVCAGASQRDIVERGARELRLPRHRILGSAPEALASSIVALVAVETDRSVRDVAIAVLGVPPRHIVVPWENATIGGLAAANLLDAPMRRRLEGRVAQLWPPGPLALASAARKMIEVLSGRTRCSMSCFVAPDDSSGRRARAAALPARLGPEGLVSEEVPVLTPHDRTALDTAMLL